MRLPIIDLKFQDIRTINGRLSIVPKCKLTLEDFEKQLEAITYTGQNKKRTDEVEKYMKLPYFAQAIITLIMFNQRVPTEEQYLKYYFDLCNDQNITIKDKEAVEGRALRAYSSILREYHFFLMCQESKLFEKVGYSLVNDILNGVDITIQQNNAIFSIKLYIDTSRANDFAVKKITRHKELSSWEIHMPLDMSKTTGRISNFYLYDINYVKTLCTIINDQIKTFSS